jgi:lipoprotein-anchoring transpeptidase ErfK/SrfK
MFKTMSLALLGGASFFAATIDHAAALDAAGFQQPTVIYGGPPPQSGAPVRNAYVESPRMGGGFIEFLFGNGPGQGQRQGYRQRGGGEPPQVYQQQPSNSEPQQALPEQEQAYDPTQRPLDPKYEKQLVDYDGKERAGTIVIDTPNKFLYLVQGDGRAVRYGIGVGRPGFTWAGVKTVSAKREWPDWTPPPEMLARRPDLPRHMEGGPQNPLGARAMYLGSSLYRIHGSNEPWTIGTNVSSGCIRMRNEDVIDLYGRVNVGARVIVL